MKISQKLALRYTRARINILSLAAPRKAAIKAFRLFCTPQQRVTKKGSAFFEKGEPLSFRYAGHSVRGRRWLPAELPRKRVLIAHGFESASRNFDAYIAALVEKGYEVVAFDAPAHGRSGGRRILLTDYVGVLRKIEQSYGPFHSYLGHSLGGLALGLFLENTPHNRVTRLVLIAPAVETIIAVDTFARRMQLSPQLVREMDDYVQETSGHHFDWFSLRRALHQVHATTLYLQDDEDRITPVKDAMLVRDDAHSNVKFIFTNGLGHRKIYKDAEVMGRIVAFL
ncbi:alpha/beta hydrolase [Puia sp.]|jgi:alpha-beta hydrolase superfamily lysophospholipase|uniref:alpha/beta hydrolase n=1 Tax=Puia sp. TaxID=2045100 RepID=UPI002F40C2A8